MTNLTALPIAALDVGRRYREHVRHAGPVQKKNFTLRYLFYKLNHCLEIKLWDT